MKPLAAFFCCLVPILLSGCAVPKLPDRSGEVLKVAQHFGFTPSLDVRVARCVYYVADKNTWLSPNTDFLFGVCVVDAGVLYLSDLDRRTGVSTPLMKIAKLPGLTISLCNSALQKQLQVNRQEDRVALFVTQDGGFGTNDSVTVEIFDALKSAGWPVINTVRRVQLSPGHVKPTPLFAC